MGPAQQFGLLNSQMKAHNAGFLPGKMIYHRGRMINGRSLISFQYFRNI